MDQADVPSTGPVYSSTGPGPGSGVGAGLLLQATVNIAAIARNAKIFFIIGFD
jgi:hypothetical protein